MKKYDILQYPDKRLLRKAKPVKEINQEIKDIVVSMLYIVRKTYAVGLAAPQIGVNKRIIVVEIKNKLVVMINPDISYLTYSLFNSVNDVILSKEGCLSIDNGKTVFVKNRYREVAIQADDLNNNMHTYRLKGFPAIIAQHEYDHLEGRLINDKNYTN